MGGGEMKYRFMFKGLDETSFNPKELYRKIINFYAHHYYIRDSHNEYIEEGPPNSWVAMYIDVWDSRYQLAQGHSPARISVHINTETERKQVGKTMDYGLGPKGVDFDRDELKFFDTLGFTLSIKHTRDTEQLVEDWWSMKDEL